MDQADAAVVEIILLPHREERLAQMEDCATQIEFAEILKLVPEVKEEEEVKVEVE